MTDELRLLRQSEVLRRTGLKRSTLYDRIRRNLFPKPVTLFGGDRRCVGWVEHEVDAAIRACIETRDAVESPGPRPRRGLQTTKTRQ